MEGQRKLEINHVFLAVAGVILFAMMCIQVRYSTLSYDGGIAVHVSVRHITTPSDPLPVSDLYSQLEDVHSLGTAASWQKQVGMHPPLYFFVLNLWARVTDLASPIALYLPNFILALLTLFFLGRIANYTLNRGAHLVLLYAALSPWLLGFTTFLRPYILVVALTTMSTWLCLLFQNNKDSKRIACMYSVVAALGLYTHYYFVFVIAWQFIWNAFVLSSFDKELRNEKLKEMFFMGVGITILFSPWIPIFLKHLRITKAPERYYNQSHPGIRVARYYTALLLLLPYAILAHHFLKKRNFKRLKLLTVAIIGTYLLALAMPFFSPFGQASVNSNNSELSFLLAYLSYWVNHMTLSRGIGSSNSFFGWFPSILFLGTYFFWLIGLNTHAGSKASSRYFWLMLPILPLIILSADLFRNSNTIFVVKLCFPFVPLLFLGLIDATLNNRFKRLGRMLLFLWGILFCLALANNLYQRIRVRDSYEQVADYLARNDSPEHLIVINTKVSQFLIPLLLECKKKGAKHSLMTSRKSIELTQFIDSALKDGRYKRITLVNQIQLHKSLIWPDPLIEMQCKRAKMNGWQIQNGARVIPTRSQTNKTLVTISRAIPRFFSH
jgi:hypothetical protein